MADVVSGAFGKKGKKPVSLQRFVSAVTGSGDSKARAGDSGDSAKLRSYIEQIAGVVKK